MKEAIIKYTPYGVVCLLLIAYMHSCVSHNKEVKGINKSWSYKEAMYNHNESTLKRSVTKQGEKIVSQELLIVTKDSEIAASLLENERLKNIKSKVRVVTKTIIKEVFVPYEVTVFDSASGDSVKPFKVLNKWYGVSGVVLTKGIRFDSIQFKNDITVTIGEESQGLFKKRKSTVDLSDKSPFSTITNSYNVVIEKGPKKWYETKGAAIGLGIIGGLYLNTKIR